ncbi:MAG: DUF3450 domain-containing protein [Proteobacteria bacterium]|nr:DUF3450 domain-containing protein [Pseudomonadota bacterium]
MTRRLKAFAFLSAMVGLMGPADAGAESLKDVVKTDRERHAEGAKAQQRIDKIHEQRTGLAAEYQSVLEQIDALKVYNRQVDTLIGSQEKELASLDRQIQNATVFSRALTPLMLKMIDALDNLRKLDVPFLAEERKGRVERLKALMSNSAVSDSERYRQILGAYRIESDYGRTIEHYKGPIEVDGQKRTVDFLRVGRLALLYRSLDGKEVGAWNQATRRWEKLPNRYRDAVKEGLRIARKEKAPNDLLWLPVPAPQEDSK